MTVHKTDSPSLLLKIFLFDNNDFQVLFSDYTGEGLSNKILIVDDNIKLSRSLARNFNLHNYHTHISLNKSEALSSLKSGNYSLIILDIMLGDESGLDLLNEIRGKGDSTPVIIMTGHATVDNAILALKYGAADYVRKPVKFSSLLDTAEKALKKTAQVSSSEEMEGEFVTVNRHLLEELEHVRKIAATDIPVLISGESGTGKEIIAEMIHSFSDRSGYRMEKLNCAALPETLLENELFGHRRGAYTGASESYRGIFERSDKSTLFLDEIGDMVLSTQSKILRALQNQEIRAVGSENLVKINVRFIAATNRDLGELIKKGEFREDLYYRLNAGHIFIPPLRDRVEDVPVLLDYFLSYFSPENGKGKTFDDYSKEILLSYKWPGNVRELKNMVQYCIAVSKKDIIGEEDLPRQITEKTAKNSSLGEGNLMQFMEKELIEETLRKTGFNKKKAAALLNISRTTLYQKIMKYEIKEF